MTRTIRWCLSFTALISAVLCVMPVAKVAQQSRPKPEVLIPAGPLFTPTIDGQRMRDNALYGVSCVTWTLCIAVGTQAAQSELGFRPLAEQWTGARWRVIGARSGHHAHGFADQGLLPVPPSPACPTNNRVMI